MFARTSWTLCAIVACAFTSSASAAEWSGWKSVGGQITGEPSIVAYGSGNVAVVARGTDDAMWWTKSIDGGKTFGEWKTLGGVLTSSPSCVSKQSGNFDCFVRGTPNGGVFQRGYMNGNWSEWIGHGGSISSGPAAAAKYHQTVVVTGVANSKLHWRVWNATSGWSGWEPVQGPISSLASFECDQSPHGVCDEMDNSCESRLVCLARSGGKMMAWDLFFSGSHGGGSNSTNLQSNWYGEVSYVPLTDYRPDVVLNNMKSGHFFIIDRTTRSLKTAPWTTGVGLTGPWQDLGGTFKSGPSCAGKSTFICAGRGDNGEVWVSRQL